MVLNLSKKPKVLMAGVLLLALLLPLILAETEYYKLNDEVNLKFICTLNNAIPSASTDYNITISYPNGTTFINNDNTTALGNGAFEYMTNFTTIGTYKVQMFCYDGTYSFSDEGYYEITGNGKSNPDGIVIVLFSLAFLIIMGFLIYTMILSIGHFASLDLDVVDLSKSIGIYFALLGLYLLSLSYLGNPTLDSWMLLFIEIGGFTHIIIPITAFLISISIGSLRKKKIDFGTRRILRRNVGNIGGFR
jgi:hypothetical protein